MSLPNLDMREFLHAPQSAAGARFARELTDACHGLGFCYLSAHGVPAELDAAIMDNARAFFALPESERRALAIVNSPHFRGYTELGGERTKNVRDWREQLDLGPEEPAARVPPSAPAWQRLRGPNQWPASLPTMRPVVLEWMSAMAGVGLAVLRALALGLGQPLHYFDAFVLPRGDPHLKIIRYPAQERRADTGQGVGMHHDSGLLSFVLQDGVGGLQVEHGSGLIDATPRHGTYVMNLNEAPRAKPARARRARFDCVLLSSAAGCGVRADYAAARARGPGTRRTESRSERSYLRHVRRQLSEDQAALARGRRCGSLRRRSHVTKGSGRDWRTPRPIVDSQSARITTGKEGAHDAAAAHGALPGPLR
jgi:isopenicillin N synthase-like dioxygenase